MDIFLIKALYNLFVHIPSQSQPWQPGWKGHFNEDKTEDYCRPLRRDWDCTEKSKACPNESPQDA